MNQETIDSPARRGPSAMEKTYLVPTTFILTIVFSIFFPPGVVLGIFAIVYSFQARDAYDYGYAIEGAKQHTISRRFIGWQIGVTAIAYLAGITFMIFWSVNCRNRPGESYCTSDFF